MSVVSLTSGLSLKVVHNYSYGDTVIHNLSLKEVHNHSYGDTIIKGASMKHAGYYDPGAGKVLPFYSMNYNIIRKI